MNIKTTIRSAAICILTWLAAVAISAGESVVTLKLIDGRVVKGEIIGRGPTDITVSTDLGVIRLQRAKLTEDSKAVLGDDARGSADVAKLRQRIAELEKELALLRVENDELRKRLAPVTPASSSPAGSHGIRGSSEGSSKAKTKPEAPGSHWMTSSSGKRHNSGCRYFRTSKGRPCGPSDGIACKICGG